MPARETLQVAYVDTTYRVLVNRKPIDVRIGAANAALDRLLEACDAQNWAFVSAHNPRSQPLPAADNARRDARLKALLDGQESEYLDAIALPDDPGWPPETGVFIIGMDDRAAAALGKRFGQLAVVCGVRGGAPYLVWLDEVVQGSSTKVADCRR